VHSEHQPQKEDEASTILPRSPTVGAKRSRSQRGGSSADTTGELTSASSVVERSVKALTAKALKFSTGVSGSDIAGTAAVLASGVLTHQLGDWRVTTHLPETT
jgi:hypothetical protein